MAIWPAMPPQRTRDGSKGHDQGELRDQLNSFVDFFAESFMSVPFS
jgi:hypothetical protein